MTESEVLDELFAASDNEIEQQIPDKNTESEPQSETEEFEELEKKIKRKSSKKRAEVELDEETSQNDGKLIYFITE